MRLCLDCGTLTRAARCPAHAASFRALRPMGRARQTLRASIIQRDGTHCRACGAGPLSNAAVHLDHIRPLADWPPGTPPALVNHPDNLAILCARCNLRKGAGA
jgi:5-methylcytosine-specific restriction endonuclease McrA